MSAVSKEILDKLRQLSDLLIVIKDSGNNTPQILKELAVEKCSEIYSALASEESMVGYKIVDTPKEDCIEDSADEKTSTEIVFNGTDENEEQSNEPIEEENDEVDFELPSITIEEVTTQMEENEEEFVNSDTISTDEDTTFDDCNFQDDDNDIESNSDKNEEIEEKEIIIEEEEEEQEEEEEEIDLFATKENFKKCSHKKIRSVLSINDIFLYKRELFGNSDVDMTDMFDGIDEAESFEEAMDIISEYFGSDADSEEMVIEFVERVKQCFE